MTFHRDYLYQGIPMKIIETIESGIVKLKKKGII